MKIMETLLLCGEQNIAIRDHTPERSNFMAILNSKAQGDPNILRTLIVGRNTHHLKSRMKLSTLQEIKFAPQLLISVMQAIFLL